MPDSVLQTDLNRARELADRYCFKFVDLNNFQVDRQLLQSIPLDLMVKYEFFPLEDRDHSVTIAVSDPSGLQRLDELELKLGRHLNVKVAAASQLRDLLKTTEPSRRVLDEATEDFRVTAGEEERGE